MYTKRFQIICSPTDIEQKIIYLSLFINMNVLFDHLFKKTLCNTTSEKLRFTNGVWIDPVI